ncbi:MAG TPA: hypothetical protein VLB74_12740 [Flavobacterium sp.]|uniref:hypothetical protein n=1 Tax=Flavobacterium sp. TaxID=239 RepID=UPI002C37902F|nr:hypothetical protein [Flavobacterium sp.]HSD15510.1 hypothetical protein [Flavobacterium sp.]
MPQNKLLHLTTFGVGLLAIGLITVSFKLYDFSLKNEELKDKIKLEKSIHQNQISEILKRYDSLNKEFADKSMVAKKPMTANAGVLPAKQNVDYDSKSNSKKEREKLTALNISARGVHLISDDVVETNVSSKIDQVRVRFTLVENKDIESGIKKIFIQVTNPKHRFLTLDGKSKTQLVKEIYYDRFNTDACVFIDLHQYQLIVGDYKINLINEGEIIGTTNFRVN